MDIQSGLAEFENELSEVQTSASLDELELSYMGRNGKINAFLSEMKSLTVDQKKEMGGKINELKQTIIAKIKQKREELLSIADDTSSIDVTLPGTHYPKGSLHLVSYAIEEITNTFAKIGFIRMSYPEVEWEHNSFEALNMPPVHPARDDFETFFIDQKADSNMGRVVLTPHTSSGQIRELARLKDNPVIRMINIAKTYRPNWDASHVPMFHQFEGMCVDRDITISHLKGTLDYFAKSFFGEKRQIRLRPFHFQFTEPSFEVDISCGVCEGTGDVNGNRCKICKSGWLELGGSGMIHPNVLTMAGVDPKKYSGFAFGWGVERVVSMKEGLKIDDLRVIYSGDIRFLEQF
jgi:phenylalanyl-tRNA synthetase alpha chain